LGRAYGSTRTNPKGTNQTMTDKPKPTPTLALPITASSEDQKLLRCVNAGMRRRGLRTRTSYIRALIMDDNERVKK